MNLSRSTGFVLAVDLVLTAFAWFLALAFHGAFPIDRISLTAGDVPLSRGPQFHSAFPIDRISLKPFFLGLLWLLPSQALALLGLRVHHGVWRFFSPTDLKRLAQATALATLPLASVWPLLGPLPRSVVLLHGILAIFLLALPRFLTMLRYENQNLRPQRAIILGAGRAAEGLVRELVQDKNPPYLPLALLDDDPKKWGRKIEGIPVVGGCDELNTWVRRLRSEVILLAIPSATEKERQRLVSLCERSGVPFLTLPSRRQSGIPFRGVHSLRPVSIEDLLARKQAQLDWSLISRRLAGKRVLVTGGGGSIGSELCRQLADLPIGTLIVLDHCEFNLYELERRLNEISPHLDVAFKLGSCADEATVHHLLTDYAPEVIFHAAAYKQVPLLEGQVREAVVNNVLGTYRLAKAAVEYDVDRFVLISTDKAVNPSCVMGATKRASEIICQGFHSRGKTRFITVRFGNVLNSSGSVVPLFREQIERGGPVTVTHPEVSRYFMTKEEACHLILKATAVGKGGEIFVLDMGEPIKIRELAEQMIRLSGKIPYRDIEIRYIGLRPGEKLHEELFHPQEPLLSTPYEKLLLARSRPCDLKVIERILRQMIAACEHYNESQLLKLLHCLVPEFSRAERSDGHQRTPRLHRSE